MCLPNIPTTGFGLGDFFFLFFFLVGRFVVGMDGWMSRVTRVMGECAHVYVYVYVHVYICMYVYVYVCIRIYRLPERRSYRLPYLWGRKEGTTGGLGHWPIVVR